MIVPRPTACACCGSSRLSKLGEDITETPEVSLIVTAKMNDVDPQAWLADVLARIAEHPVQKLDELLPWNWCPRNVQARQAA